MKTPMTNIMLAAVAAATCLVTAARAGSVPDRCLDECTGGEGAIHVKGWAYDPDASSQSIGIHVYLYADSGCAIQYGDVRVLTANVSRPDVNQAKGITGDHGFSADIPVSNAGAYWVKLFAIDATGDDNPQIGSTTGVTVTATGGSSAAMTNTVKVTRFHQSYPYSGKATVEYTVGGTLPPRAVAEIILNTDNASATFVQSNIVAGANSHVIDFASSFGGVLLLTNASFVVTITAKDLGGVQLWANGPYWAECNVGATMPEESGYYFWWGDTVGYKRENDVWVAADGSTSGFSFNIGNTPTYGMDNSALLSAGYIDSTGNLAAAHDAATAHLGSPWRMPTRDEIDALVSNCTSTWITTNGVNGRLVTGKGAYADKSIFLPATDYCHGSGIPDLGSDGYYWFSTPHSDVSIGAWALGFDSGFFSRNPGSREYGFSVRPVRDPAK